MAFNIFNVIRLSSRHVLNSTIPSSPRFLSCSAVRKELFEVKSHEEFLNKILNNPKPVIVNFHAHWCEPCHILTPKLKELIEPIAEIDLATIDLEHNADLAYTFEVKAVPAVIAVRNGVVVDKFIGLVDTSMIESLIKKMSDIDKNAKQ